MLAWRGGFGADVDALSEAGWGGLALGHDDVNEEKREGAGQHDGGGIAAAGGLEARGDFLRVESLEDGAGAGEDFHLLDGQVAAGEIFQFEFVDEVGAAVGA